MSVCTCMLIVCSIIKGNIDGTCNIIYWEIAPLLGWALFHKLPSKTVRVTCKIRPLEDTRVTIPHTKMQQQEQMPSAVVLSPGICFINKSS